MYPPRRQAAVDWLENKVDEIQETLEIQIAKADKKYTVDLRVLRNKKNIQKRVAQLTGVANRVLAGDPARVSEARQIANNEVEGLRVKLVLSKEMERMFSKERMVLPFVLNKRGIGKC